jgi:hypothetical protein
VEPAVDIVRVGGAYRLKTQLGKGSFGKYLTQYHVRTTDKTF